MCVCDLCTLSHCLSPHSLSPLANQQKEEWMERRTLKRDKQELLDLQLSLKNEIAAKTSVQEQLTQVTSQLAEMEK